jgi:hypothetical protein
VKLYVKKGLKSGPSAGYCIMTMLWVTERSVKQFVAKVNLLLGWNITHILRFGIV